MELPTFLKFASDATLVALIAGLVLLISAIAHLGERRRAKRNDVDRVGWVPWRDLSVVTLFVGLVLMGFAVIGWMRG